MKYKFTALLAATLLIPTATMAQTDSIGTSGESLRGVSIELREEVKDNYIFVFKNNMKAAEASSIARALTANASGQLGYVYKDTAMRGFTAKMTKAAAAKLAENNPSVAYYEPDSIVYLLQNKADPDKQPVFDPVPFSQTTPWGITRVNGVEHTKNLLRAWVIDTGIDLDHPDLNVETARGANFVTSGPNTPNDGNGHGTHVAGTIAAINNSIGVIGVAPGAAVVPIRVLDNQGFGTLSGVIAGINHVAANAQPGEVANMSLGGAPSTALDNAVIAAADLGIKFAVAAGNEGQHASGSSPARVEHPNVYTVAAINQNDTMASFSNFGNPPIDCADPGVGILSTWLNGGYNTISGTSMAAPHVAGILLLGPVAFDGYALGNPGEPIPICVH